MKISVIIPTMNRPESLLHTLEFLEKANPKPDEIIVVDQTSQAEQRRRLIVGLEKTKQRLNVVYFFQEEASLTKARNNGRKKATGDILVFMDDDVEVTSDIFLNIIDIMKNKQIALIAGLDKLSQAKKSSFFSYVAARKSWKKRKIGHVTKSILGRYPDIDSINGYVKTEWAMGYFFVVRKHLLEDWGLGWDEKLTGYAYAEDLDFSIAYCKKAEENNYQCLLTSKVVVSHLFSQEYRIERKEHIYKYLINREYIYYKYYKNTFSRFWMYWSDYIMLLQRIIMRNNGKLYRKALKFVKQNRNSIDNGNFKNVKY